ncbi:MAG TPA: ATPase domain-containing protein, partial [Fimbriimonas sp.]
EESPRTIHKRSAALGIDLPDLIERGKVKVQYIDPAEMSPGEFIDDVRAEVATGETSVVVVDSLNGYLNAMPEERFLVLQLHELLAFLGQQGVTSILVTAQNGMFGPNIAAPVEVSYLADTVLLFRLYEHRGQLQQAFSVAKRRGGRHDRTIHQLIFGGERGIEIGEPLTHLRGVMSGIPELSIAQSE